MVFHSRKHKHRINEIHEVLERDKPFTIHERNLQKLAIEMFKVNNELSVQIIGENFHFTENYYSLSHRSKTKLLVDHVKTEIYGK